MFECWLFLSAFLYVYENIYIWTVEVVLWRTEADSVSYAFQKVSLTYVSKKTTKQAPPRALPEPHVFKGQVAMLCQCIFCLQDASWMLPGSYLRSWCVSVLGPLWKITHGLCMRFETFGFRDIHVKDFFSTVTEQNRRVWALLTALVWRPKNTSLFELPWTCNISCYFQAVHVPSEKEVWKMEQIMSFGL